MNAGKNIMQIVTVAYFILVTVGLLLIARFFSVAVITNHLIPIILGLVILWFLLIFLVMRQAQKNQRKEKEEPNERKD